MVLYIVEFLFFVCFLIDCFEGLEFEVVVCVFVDDFWDVVLFCELDCLVFVFEDDVFEVLFVLVFCFVFWFVVLVMFCVFDCVVEFMYFLFWFSVLNKELFNVCIFFVFVIVDRFCLLKLRMV